MLCSHRYTFETWDRRRLDDTSGPATEVLDYIIEVVVAVTGYSGRYSGRSAIIATVAALTKIQCIRHMKMITNAKYMCRPSGGIL